MRYRIRFEDRKTGSSTCETVINVDGRQDVEKQFYKIFTSKRFMFLSSFKLPEPDKRTGVKRNGV
jgi:hypothetical protein